MERFTTDKKNFLLDGEPFTVVSGAMHYFRVPRAYWRDRLMKIKACGMNTVETYCAWNLHEPKEGTFDFEGNLDLGAYLDLIKELGMYAIVRPGPYICSEWDFGGLPWWLLKYDRIRLRCMNETFMNKTAAYFKRLIPVIAARQLSVGGPVIMVQVENEYGSYGNDSKYIRALADMMEGFGVDCTLFTSDGASASMLSGGTVPEIFATCNFGSRASENFKTLRKYRKSGPLMCAEYWNGWFDHWGEKHHRRDADDAGRNLAEILDCGASVSVYMMHGGTNFGWMNGANCGDKYEPTVNSYDDDAPINEYGGLTDKYYRMKKVLAERGFVSDVVAENETKTKAYGVLPFTHTADLLDQLSQISEPVTLPTPENMEALDQGYGFICYSAFISGPKEKNYLFMDVHDSAYVYLNGKFAGKYTRNDVKPRCSFAVPSDGAQITVLVENQGRVNYGPLLADKKGIIGGVRHGQQFLYHWRHDPLPLDDLSGLCFSPAERVKFEKRPVFLKTVLKIEGAPEDTFIRLPGFKKGVIFINGTVLSRYWDIGPQRTAYLPATILREGENEVIVLELEGFKRAEIEFTDRPELG